MAYTNVLRTLSQINKPVFTQISSNKFAQGNEYVKIEPWFSSKDVQRTISTVQLCTSKPPNKARVVAPPVKTIMHRRLFDVFARLIDPLAHPKETFADLCAQLNRNVDLLKTVTPHHKKLLNDIVHHSQSTCLPDMSYTNSKYMLFWAQLLNSKIYVVDGSMYKVYGEPTNMRSIILRVVDDQFEYVNTSFLEYQLSHNLMEYVDTRNLKSKSLDELKKICKVYKIDCNRLKKSDIVDKIEKIM